MMVPAFRALSHPGRLPDREHARMQASVRDAERAVQEQTAAAAERGALRTERAAAAAEAAELAARRADMDEQALVIKERIKVCPRAELPQSSSLPCWLEPLWQGTRSQVCIAGRDNPDP